MYSYTYSSLESVPLRIVSSYYFHIFLLYFLFPTYPSIFLQCFEMFLSIWYFKLKIVVRTVITSSSIHLLNCSFGKSYLFISSSSIVNICHMCVPYWNLLNILSCHYSSYCLSTATAPFSLPCINIVWTAICYLESLKFVVIIIILNCFLGFRLG